MLPPMRPRESLAGRPRGLCLRRGAVLDHLDSSPGTFALLLVSSSFQLPPPGGAKNTRTELGCGSVVGWVCAKFLDSAASAHEALGSGGSRLVLGTLGVCFCRLCAHLYVKSAHPSFSACPRSPGHVLPRAFLGCMSAQACLLPELEDALCTHFPCSR